MSGVAPYLISKIGILSTVNDKYYDTDYHPSLQIQTYLFSGSHQYLCAESSIYTFISILHQSCSFNELVYPETGWLIFSVFCDLTLHICTVYSE